MTLIEWRDDFRVGVPEVDFEHRGMIMLINELHAEAEGEGTKEAVIAFLGEVYAKIAAHFALEEKIMRDYRYDQYAEHKEDHERLLDEIRDIMDRYEDDADPDYEKALSAHLREWFTNHFKTKDARLHRMLM